METNRTKALAFMLVGIAAWGSSALIYRWMIVPRLPEWRSVPIWWWGIQLLPLVAAVVSAGVLSRSTREAAINGLLLVVPPVLVVSAYGAVTGRPIGHDMWVHEPLYWLVALAQVAIGVASVLVTATVSRTVIGRRHGV